MEDRLSEQQQCDHIIFSFVLYKIFTYTPKNTVSGKNVQCTVSISAEKIVSSVNSILYECLLILKFALKL